MSEKQWAYFIAYHFSKFMFETVIIMVYLSNAFKYKFVVGV